MNWSCDTFDSKYFVLLFWLLSDIIIQNSLLQYQNGIGKVQSVDIFSHD